MERTSVYYTGKGRKVAVFVESVNCVVTRLNRIRCAPASENSCYATDVVTLASTVTTTPLKAGVFDWGSAWRGTRVLASG